MNGVEGPAALAARLVGKTGEQQGAGGAGNDGKDLPGLKKAAREFEALFINQMLKTMRETVEESDLFHGGSGEKIYTSLMDMELSKEMASSGGMGLSKVLLEYFAGSDNPSAGPATDAGADPARGDGEKGVTGKVR